MDVQNRDFCSKKNCFSKEYCRDAKRTCPACVSTKCTAVNLSVLQERMFD
jgi:hypothetical protein